MANNNFPNFFSAPTDKADAEKKASKLISGLNADEKDELQEILGDRDKINAVLSPLPLKKSWISSTARKMDINEILSSLTPDDIEGLKATAEAVFGKGNEAKEKQSQPSASDMFSSIDPKMIGKLTKIMGAMNGESGKRCKLIEALKPNLSPERQKRADQAIQILKLLEILPLINNLTDRDE